MLMMMMMMKEDEDEDEVVEQMGWNDFEVYITTGTSTVECDFVDCNINVSIDRSNLVFLYLIDTWFYSNKINHSFQPIEIIDFFPCCGDVRTEPRFVNTGTGMTNMDSSSNENNELPTLSKLRVIVEMDNIKSLR